ncbi:MAG: hypothetical protein LCH32_03960 [Bacteroidetes bacterium]|nr:hypothetical protein [Bacteroidota bacterium]
MNIVSKYPYSIAIIYLWVGFVCAISFMEAWLKFKAPGVNIQIGLGIGRLVFGALNKVEWFFALSILIVFYANKHTILSINNLFYFIAFIILITQTLWLLPALDERAELRIQGKNIENSFLHVYYVLFEFIKIIALFVFSLKQYK